MSPVSVPAISQAIKLLTASLAFAEQPGLKSGNAVYEAATKLLAAKPKTLSALAGDLAHAAETLFTNYPDTPPDAAPLFAQMVEASLPDAPALARAKLDPDAACDAMLGKLTDPDHRRDPMPALFRALVTPVLKATFDNRDIIADIEPALWAEVLQGQADLKDDTSALLAGQRDMRAMMEQLLAGQAAALSLEDMTTLAAQFGEHNITDKPSLERFLTLKAEEYRALRAEVDGISDGLKRLSNLKAAAQDAIARVDLEEVETLLSRVQEVEKEEAARTAELRADNALLRGKVDQAAALLADAADSFRIVDPLEPARRRYDYMKRLHSHGVRYGGLGLPASIQMIEVAIQDLPREKDPAAWAMCKVAQGNALENLGNRTAGPEGNDLLDQAVAAYRAALEVQTRADHPIDWAMTQNNLGIALKNQGISTEGKEGADLLAQAVTAFRAALEVTTLANRPVRWAMTQNNLGNALQAQGTRTAGPAGADLLAQAVAACRAALEVTTRADHPVQWAATQNTLGSALQAQGTRTAGPAGADLLAQAVAAYRASLEVRNRKDNPVGWAIAQENIAIALLERADHDTTKQPRQYLTEALVAVEQALEVYDPEYLSQRYIVATVLRADLLDRLNSL